MSDARDNGTRSTPAIPSVYSDDGVTIIGMIGVVREAEANRGATLSLFGGGINPGAEVPAGVDPDYILDFARTHEDAGFDLVLTGYSSSTPDGFEVAGYAAAHTERLGYLIAHRPGFVAPTLAARKAATLDQLTNGRIALHIITGGNDVEQRQDGDWLDHDSRYRRTDEYLDVIRRVWTETDPFDHEGEFYHLQDALQPGPLPAAASRPAVLRRRVGDGAGRSQQAGGPLRAVGRTPGLHCRADRRRSFPSGRRRP